MCYLCLQDNPFGIKDLSKEKSEVKRERAKLIKELISFYEKDAVCSNGKTEIEKLREEQYVLSRDL